MKRFLTTLLAASCCFGALAAPPKPGAALRARIDAEEDVLGIVHWGLNTYTDKEWGFGDVDPALLAPDAFDADQIAKAAKAAGLCGLVIVAKHHDGFCLWPTKTTDYNISRSPFRGGAGDYVAEMSRACRKAGLKFGVYCSPWDRHDAAYSTAAYVETYHAQVRELLDGRYGTVFEVWFDGANGGSGWYGGAKGNRTIPAGYYRFDTLFRTVRSLQPRATIFGMGGDYAWPFNEKGVVDPEKSPHDETTFRMWEADFPLRKGWFWHAKDRGTTRSGEFLMKIYLRTVGNGGTMNIGLAPDVHGRLAAEDVAALKRFGEIRREFFSRSITGSGYSAVYVYRDENGIKRIRFEPDGAIGLRKFYVKTDLLRAVVKATGPNGETDTAKWMLGFERKRR